MVWAKNLPEQERAALLEERKKRRRAQKARWMRDKRKRDQDYNKRVNDWKREWHKEKMKDESYRAEYRRRCRINTRRHALKKRIQRELNVSIYTLRMQTLRRETKW